MKKLLSVVAIIGMLALGTSNVFAAQDTVDCPRNGEDCPRSSEECLNNNEDCPMLYQGRRYSNQSKSSKNTGSVKNVRMGQGRNCHN